MNRYQAAEYTMDALKKAGAQEVRVTASEGCKEELNAEVGEFSLYRTLFNTSLNIKALKDGRKGTATINKLDKDAIDEAVAETIAAADAGVVDEAEGIAELTRNEKFEAGVLTPNKEALFDRIQEYLAEVKDKYPKINLEQFIASYNKSEEIFLNSNGVVFEKAAGSYNYNSMFTGQDGEKSTSFSGYGVTFTDVSKKFLDYTYARQTLLDTLNSFDPITVDGKFIGPVIFSPDCVSFLMYMVSMMFAGEGSIIDGTSIWMDRLGKQVASPKLTIGMNPHDLRIICGERYTGDGYLAEDCDIIKDGVLQTFLLSRYGSRKTGHARAKNLSHSFIIDNGDKAFGEMVKSIDKGLLVNRFSGGMPAPNGDFSGVAKNSFVIENGKVGKPISETMISGNIVDILNNILAISKDTIADGGSVLPWILMDGVTISGK